MIAHTLHPTNIQTLPAEAQRNNPLLSDEGIIKLSETETIKEENESRKKNESKIRRKIV